MIPGLGLLAADFPDPYIRYFDLAGRDSAELRKEGTAFDLAIAVVRVDAHGLVIACHRLVEPALIVLHNAEVVPGLGEVLRGLASYPTHRDPLNLPPLGEIRKGRRNEMTGARSLGRGNG